MKLTERRNLGNTGYLVSPITFGGIINMSETQSDADRFVASAIESGINYFDVAPSYGNAEDRLGPALEPYRKDVYLACKTEFRDAKRAEQELHASLRKLRTDHFDVYQMHALSTQEDIDVAFGPGGVMELMCRAKEKGIIRKIGFSTHNEDAAMQALTLFDFDTVLFPMNWALGVNTGWGDRISAYAASHGTGLLAMKTLAHRKWRETDERLHPKGWYKPVYESEKLGVAAMKYGLYKGAATLVSPGNFERFSFMLDHIEQCLSEPLTEEEWALLRTEAAAIRNEMIFNP